MSTVQTLHFWTNGESFTNLVRMFIEEGNVKKVYDILKEGNLPDHLIRNFFLFKYKFEGDTRVEPDLNIVKDNTKIDEENHLYWLISNIKGGETFEQFFYDIDHEVKLSKDTVYLLMLFDINEIKSKIWKKVLKYRGYNLNPSPLSMRSCNGVILEDGTFVECEYMGHKDLYPLLYALNLTTAGDWTHEDKTIHITAGQLGGSIVKNLRYYIERRNNPTEAQLDTIFRYKESIRSVYSQSETAIESIREMIVSKEDMGGKYGNLAFIKRFYPKIPLPKFSKQVFESDNLSIRTSPDRSLPGLLNSKFNVKDVELAIKEIEEEYEKVKDVRDHNNLHYFFQEKIDGLNGVCHYYKEGEFSYALSGNQGDVVGGKKGSRVLQTEEYDKLRAIARQLYEDLKSPLQLEFVVNDGEIYIVQLRLLENNPEETVISSVPDSYLYIGRTFSRGVIDVDIKDILIVDSEAKSEDLIGKKALIVKEDVAFSHILALSKALEIPSIYATGDIDLSNYNKVKIKAYNKEGYICKID